MCTTLEHENQPACLRDFRYSPHFHIGDQRVRVVPCSLDVVRSSRQITAYCENHQNGCYELS